MVTERIVELQEARVIEAERTLTKKICQSAWKVH